MLKHIYLRIMNAQKSLKKKNISRHPNNYHYIDNNNMTKEKWIQLKNYYSPHESNRTTALDRNGTIDKVSTCVVDRCICEKDQAEDCMRKVNIHMRKCEQYIEGGNIKETTLLLRQVNGRNGLIKDRSSCMKGNRDGGELRDEYHVKDKHEHERNRAYHPNNGPLPLQLGGEKNTHHNNLFLDKFGISSKRGKNELKCELKNELNDNLMLVLNYSSLQVLRSLNMRYAYVNSKEYFMSLSLICNQLAVNKFNDKEFWLILSNKLTKVLKIKNINKIFCIRWLSLILNSFARVHILNKDFMKEASAVIMQCRSKDEMHSFDISQIVNSFSKLNYIDYNLFEFLEKFIYDKIDELSYQSISNICNAYCKLGKNNEILFSHLSKRVQTNLDKFNEQELANILNSYSKLNEKYVNLFNKSLQHVLDRFYKFKPVEIVMITNAYSKCNIYCKSFFSSLYCYIKNYSALFQPGELAIIANSYATFNMREVHTFEFIKKRIINKEYLLEDRNVAMLLHAYGKLLIRDEDFILNLLKKKKDVIKSLDSRNLTLFYVSLVKLNIHIPPDIYKSFKIMISKNLYSFTDLALVSICYASMFYMYFDMKLISSILLLLNKRQASSRSFAHQIHVSLFVLHTLYDFCKFSFKFIECLYHLLIRAYHYVTQPNYYDINKSGIQKRIYPFIPKKFINVHTEVPVGPFVVDFLLLRRIDTQQSVRQLSETGKAKVTP
ncbi:heptatricopeptide repeat-containing protein [Plasmodium brasilianum]|uniref:Heptatricopeptide repeat-containing protein n=1 Tax=Plasmodium brasilianum TaxID=5824 RepID=A0ACB9YB20_PLABR|nr:heptatricopeptide repeat-containing protein [Plasmodium brasilianum]